MKTRSRRRKKNALAHNFGLREEEDQQEFEKCHHVEPVKDSQQTTTVCFKSHKFKEEVYKKIKTKK